MSTQLRLTELPKAEPQTWDVRGISLWMNAPAADLTALQKTIAYSGSIKAELGELFDIQGDINSKHLQIHTTSIRLDSLGLAMQCGEIELFGDGGDGIAQDLRGGSVHVHGSVGDLAGAGMRGGRLIISGNAVDRLGAVSPKSGRGMRGGDIFALSDVGNQVGASMRRGTIYVAGSAGANGACRMVAGTVIVMKRIGAGWAGGMKRGSVILGQPAGEEWAALLSPSHEFELSFLPILWKYLASQTNGHSIGIPSTRWAKRQVGDLINAGQGEVLTLTKLS